MFYSELRQLSTSQINSKSLRKDSGKSSVGGTNKVSTDSMTHIAMGQCLQQISSTKSLTCKKI